MSIINWNGCACFELILAIVFTPAENNDKQHAFNCFRHVFLRKYTCGAATLVYSQFSQQSSVSHQRVAL